jgi:hypothetical protein
MNKWVKLTCSLPWMNVKPKLEFFVNGKKAKHKVSDLNKWVKLTSSILPPWMNVKPKLEFFVNGKKAKHKVSEY